MNERAHPASTQTAVPRPGLTALDDALQQLLAQALPLGRTENVSTFDADGRVHRQW